MTNGQKKRKRWSSDEEDAWKRRRRENQAIPIYTPPIPSKPTSQLNPNFEKNNYNQILPQNPIHDKHTVALTNTESLPSPPSSHSSNLTDNMDHTETIVEVDSFTIQKDSLQYHNANSILAQAHLQRLQRLKPEQISQPLKPVEIPIIPDYSFNSVLQQLHRSRRNGPEWQEPDDDDMEM